MTRYITLRRCALLMQGAAVSCALLVSCGGSRSARNNDSEDSVTMRQWQASVAGLEGSAVAVNPVPAAQSAPVRSAADMGGQQPQALLPESPYTKRYNNINEAPFQEIFNDSNKYQYYHAERLGIRPIQSAADAFCVNRPLVRIQSNEQYVLDSLTHSVPYLIPLAEKLLWDIGNNFTAKAKQRTGGDYRIRVTSLLRTPETVKSLKKVNGNATDSSTHQFATTFDITYTRFLNTRTGQDEDVRGLKEALAETLLELRNAGRCMVKYEVKSPCFHVTVRK